MRVEIVGHIVHSDLKRNCFYLRGNGYFVSEFYADLVDDGTGIVNVIKWLPSEKEGVTGRKELNLGDLYMIRGHVAFYREEIQVNAEEMSKVFELHFGFIIYA